MKKILFICMGNICRSPTAEGVMQKFVNDSNLSEKIYIDSAGMIGYHVGQKADGRMRSHAERRGFNLLSISRQFDPSYDFNEFDYIIAMDNDNMRDLKSMDIKGNFSGKLYKMTEFCNNIKADVVPDPYYGGEQGFERVIDIIEDGCNGLLTRIKDELEC